MLSIHLYLSNTVKNPCRKTNWHSSVVHCDGNYHRNGSLGRQSNLILWSQTKKKARNGLWLIREQMDRTLPACRLASEWLNLVNFPRPVASSLSTSDGVAGFSRWLVMSGGGVHTYMLLLLLLLSLSWVNVDPPVEVKARYTFLHLQRDYLSLQWHRMVKQTHTHTRINPWSCTIHSNQIDRHTGPGR